MKVSLCCEARWPTIDKGTVYATFPTYIGARTLVNPSNALDH